MGKQSVKTTKSCLAFCRDRLWALSVFIIFYFTLSVVTSGLTLTGGLFIPMMLTGAAVGRFVGELVLLMFPGVPDPRYVP